MTKAVYESKTIDVIKEDGKRIRAELSIWEIDAENEDRVKLRLRIDDKEFEQSSENFFDAIRSIRYQLESQNLLLSCYGASQNVYPSPMMLDIGDGSIAYKLKFGVNPTTNDIVSIFDTGDDVTPVTVSNQEEFYKNWLNSF